MTILAGDIGGTNSRLAIYEARDGRLLQVAARTYSSLDYDGLESILESFLRETGAKPTAAGFGIPGPVRDNRAITTGLRWEVDATTLRGLFGLESAVLLNDIQAIGNGLLFLPDENFATLQAGTRDPEGSACVIAAGTGLGEGVIAWDGRRHIALPSEGGHADFAPSTVNDVALLHFLQRNLAAELSIGTPASSRPASLPHVSWEQVLQGRGLCRLFEFLSRREGPPMPEWLADYATSAEGPAAIVRAAGEGIDPRADEAVDWFARLYGAEAGNLALKTLATGGVFVAGGVGPKILDERRARIFMDAFLDKGRMRGLLNQMPVRMAIGGEPGLLGAANAAWQTLKK